MILRNIDLPADLIKELPENQEKVIKYLHSNLVNLDLSLQNLQSQVKLIKKSDPELKNLPNQLKQTESKLERLLSVHKNKTENRVDSLEENFESFQGSLSKNLENFAKRLETLENDKSLMTSFFKLKEDIQNDYVKPFQFELKENYKAIHLLEQSLKVQSWNQDSSLKEFSSRFDVHREKMLKLESTVSDFLKSADELVGSIIAPVHKEVQQCQKSVEDVYSKFLQETDEVLKDLAKKDNERQKVFQSEFKKVHEEKSDLDKLLNGFQTTRNVYLQDFNNSIQKVFLAFDGFKAEVKAMFFDTFDNIRNDISEMYRKELKVIQDKLKWVPHDTDDMENMTPLEARLFTIETRIRAEENNRIVQVNSLLSGT
jgi:DNA repair exonuclease SbcCD ATPase subunit